MFFRNRVVTAIIIATLLCAGAHAVAGDTIYIAKDAGKFIRE